MICPHTSECFEFLTQAIRNLASECDMTLTISDGIVTLTSNRNPDNYIDFTVPVHHVALQPGVTYPHTQVFAIMGVEENTNG